MKYYESTPYTTKDYTEYAKKPVYDYGTGDSHETQLRLSTNDAYYIYADHFRDPRPGAVADQQHDPGGQLSPLAGGDDGLEVRPVAAGEYRKPPHGTTG